MNIETRKQEIINALTSCNRPTYKKEELLPEMMSLQKEVLEITFSKDHAGLADLRLWDVERHLEQLNEQCGGIATQELERFRLQSKEVCNLIKAEISGNRGEYKTNRTLEYLTVPNIVLKNVEFNDKDGRTEMDSIVVTPNGITIVEVKNTSRTVYIDELGNFYRTGDYLHLDCNIASKMQKREAILKKVLASIGIENVTIQSVLLFTNSRIEIQNKYNGITVSFLGQLNHYIENMVPSSKCTQEDMNAIVKGIMDNANRNEYALDFDPDMFKEAFAETVAKLEIASSACKSNDTEVIEEARQPEPQSESFKEKALKFLHSNLAKGIGGAAVIAIVFFTSSLITKKIIRNGGAD